MSSAEKQFWGTIPEGDYDRIQVSQRFQRCIEESSKSHISDFYSSSFNSFAHHENIRRFQIPVQHPIGVKVMYAIQNLIQETLDHSLGYCDGFLVCLGCAMEFDYVPQIVFGKVKEKPHFSVRVREEDANQVDHVDVLQFPQQLEQSRTSQVNARSESN